MTQQNMMPDNLKDFEQYVGALEMATPTFDDWFQNYIREAAAKTVAFYTPKLFTPEQKDEVAKVLYLMALLGADQYTRHECRKLATDIRSAVDSKV